MRDDSLRLQDMLDTITRIAGLVRQRTRDDFDSGAEIRAAMLYEFCILGEAAYTISRALKSRHPEVEWRTISGMRHWIIHDYFQVNLNIVWQTAIHDVPELENKIRVILEQELGSKPENP